MIQEQTADERRKRQEHIKKEKEAKRKSIGAAEKLKVTMFGKNQELPVPEVNVTPPTPINKEAKEKLWENTNDIITPVMENTIDRTSRVSKCSKGPYNDLDPLHVCHLNDKCHQRYGTQQRCHTHTLDKEELEIKQKVLLRHQNMLMLFM